MLSWIVRLFLIGVLAIPSRAQVTDCSYGPSGLCLVRVVVETTTHADGTTTKKVICEWGECKKDQKQNEERAENQRQD